MTSWTTSLAVLLLALVAVTNASVCTTLEIDPLETQYPSVLDADQSGFAVANQLSLFAAVPTPEGRGTIIGEVRAPTASTINEGCSSLDAINVFSLALDVNEPCEAEFSASFVWDACGFDIVDGAADGFTRYEILFVISYDEDIGELRGQPITRNVRNEHYIYIDVQTVVEVSSGTVTVFDNVNSIAAISSQDYQRTTNEVTAELALSLQWPFLSDGAGAVATTSSGHIVSAVLVASEVCPFEAPCLQVFNFTIPMTDECVLDSTIEFQVVADCNPLFTEECPVQAGEGGIVIEFDLLTQDWCPQLVDTVEVNGELASYEDEAFAVPRTAFIEGATVYFAPTFEVTATDGGAGLIIGEAELQKISLNLDYSSITDTDSFDASLDDEPIVLWELADGGTLPVDLIVSRPADAVATVVRVMGADGIIDDALDGFHLILDPAVFVTNFDGSTSDYSVTAQYEITYLSGNVKKRSVYEVRQDSNGATEVRNADVAAVFSAQAADGGVTENSSELIISAASDVAPSLVGLAALFALLL